MIVKERKYKIMFKIQYDILFFENRFLYIYIICILESWIYIYMVN